MLLNSKYIKNNVKPLSTMMTTASPKQIREKRGKFSFQFILSAFFKERQFFLIITING